MDPYWEGHRQWAAPPVAAQVQSLRADGRVAVLSERLLDAQREGDLMRVTYRLRGDANTSTLAIGHVATGEVGLTGESPFVNLLRRGLLQPDPLGLGVLTDGHFAPLDARGTPVQRVPVIGPMLKADLFESTAVSELRMHAESLATGLLAKVPKPFGSACLNLIAVRREPVLVR